MRLIHLSLITALCLSGLAHAQDTKKKDAPTTKASTADPQTEKLIQDGLQAYRSGKGQEAVAKLQMAINKIQTEGARSLEDFLPEVDGWTGDKPRSSSGSWGAGEQAFQWSQADRTYRSDDAQVKVTISNSPTMVQAQSMMFANPQIINMMNMDPNKTVTSIKADGWTGFKMVEKGKKSSIIALSGKLLVMMEVKRDDMPLLESFLGAMDLEGLRAAGK